MIVWNQLRSPRPSLTFYVFSSSIELLKALLLRILVQGSAVGVSGQRRLLISDLSLCMFYGPCTARLCALGQAISRIWLVFQLFGHLQQFWVSFPRFLDRALQLQPFSQSKYWRIDELSDNCKIARFLLNKCLLVFEGCLWVLVEPYALASFPFVVHETI
jgi:hypothetical protein